MKRIRKYLSFVMIFLLLININMSAFAENGTTTNNGKITVPSGTQAKGRLQLGDGAVYNFSIQEYREGDEKSQPNNPINFSSTAAISLNCQLPNDNFDIDDLTLTLVTDKAEVEEIKKNALEAGQPAIGALILDDGNVYRVTEKVTPLNCSFDDIIGYLIYDCSAGELILNYRNALSRIDRMYEKKFTEGTVFRDMNENAVQDSGEPGVADMTLDIVRGNDKTTVKTDANGYYKKFLPGGAYNVSLVGLEARMKVTTGNNPYATKLDAKNMSNNAKIGLINKGYIAVTELVIGEPSFDSEFTIVLSEKDKPVIKEIKVKQGTPGKFVDLPDGVYTVTQLNQFGFSTKSVDVTINSDNLEPSVAFENERLGILEGIVFYDKDKDGVMDADEKGMSGINIKLNNTITLTTDEAGKYKYSGVGEFNLTVDPGSINGLTLTTVKAVPQSGAITRNATTVALPIGYYEGKAPPPTTAPPPPPATNGTLFGTVFFDANGNGVKEADEVGLLGVKVTAGSIPASTGANGNYSIVLPAGTATAVVDGTTIPAGMVITTPGKDSQSVVITVGQFTYPDPVGYWTPPKVIKEESQPAAPPVTVEPTPVPTAVPTPIPTAVPTLTPTPEPTAAPTEAPTPTVVVPEDETPAGTAVTPTPTTAPTVIEKDKTPGAPVGQPKDAKLPKTGGVPQEIFYGVGAVLIVFGVVIRKKTS